MGHTCLFIKHHIGIAALPMKSIILIIITILNNLQGPINCVYSGYSFAEIL